MLANNDRTIQKFARWGPLTFFPFIIFINHYIINAYVVAQWRTWWLAMWMTWVRSQVFTLSIYFFSINNHMQVDGVVPWYTSRSKRTRVQEIQIKGAGLKNTINVSQRCYTLVGKSNGPEACWAIILGSIPPYWGLNPPWFANSIYFSHILVSIVIFFIIICLI